MPADFPKRGEVWRHYKGTLYKIDRITYDEESGRVRVTYFAAYESEGDPEVVHGRLLDVFLGYDPDSHAKRFIFVSPPNDIPVRRSDDLLVDKIGQAYQVLRTLSARMETGSGITIKQREWDRLLNYFGNEPDYDPDFLPWPRAI